MASVARSPRPCLCVFAKPPRRGEVKTRLARAYGAEAAVAMAQAFFTDTWSALSCVAWADVILATTDTANPGVDLPAGTTVWPQGDGTIGDRMERVLRRALETHTAAIALGTDSPGMPMTRLDAARAALEQSHAVIGPSTDGGFYLLGLRRCPPALLADLPWSSPDTSQATIERLRAVGLTTSVIAPWFDVDEPDDVTLLRHLLHMGHILAPATAKVLA